MATGKNCPHGFKQQSGSVMFRSRIIGGEMGSWRVPDSVKMTDETFLYINKKKKKGTCGSIFPEIILPERFLCSTVLHHIQKEKTKQNKKQTNI